MEEELIPNFGYIAAHINDFIQENKLFSIFEVKISKKY